jgi:uncharacterized protein YaaN involved in tellurite resistance
MTKDEMFELLHRRILRLDERCGDLAPDSDQRHKLETERDALSQRQQQLAAKIFDEQSSTYQALSGQLKAIDGQIESVIASLERFEETVALLRRMVSVADQIIGVARGAALP